jgi:hypothetical protein
LIRLRRSREAVKCDKTSIAAGDGTLIYNNAMPLYLYLLENQNWETSIAPSLAAAWQQRSFVPCRDLCRSLLPRCDAFAQQYQLGPEKPLITSVVSGMPFDRRFWHHLVSEILVYAAEEIPEIETAPETMCCLLAPTHYRNRINNRASFAPIQQVHFGTRDLVFGGGHHRPEHAGWNSVEDVRRLAQYLAAQNPGSWRPADLELILAQEEDRIEELDYVREWYPSLRHLFERAAASDWIVVCENVS